MRRRGGSGFRFQSFLFWFLGDRFIGSEGFVYAFLSAVFPVFSMVYFGLRVVDLGSFAFLLYLQA